jgi:hypothetical protein
MSESCVSCRVSRHMLEKPGMWEHVRQVLMSQYMRDFLPEMIGDGHHHVMKFDYAIIDDRFGFEGVEYRLYCRHSIAEVERVRIATFEEELRKENAKPACRWCGNILVLDKRGGCSACGGWVEDPRDRDRLEVAHE